MLAKLSISSTKFSTLDDEVLVAPEGAGKTKMDYWPAFLKHIRYSGRLTMVPLGHSSTQRKRYVPALIYWRPLVNYGGVGLFARRLLQSCHIQAGVMRRRGSEMMVLCHSKVLDEEEAGGRADVLTWTCQVGETMRRVHIWSFDASFGKAAESETDGTNPAVFTGSCLWREMAQESEYVHVSICIPASVWCAR